ncbi:hypothetical protein D3C87_1896270 [compost metagenome]
MTYRRAFHWRFHRARTAAGTNIQFAQPQLCANPAGIQIFRFIDGVAAPADDHIRRFAHVQCTGVTQNGEHQVRHVDRAFQIQMLEAAGVVNLSVNKQDVAQDSKQVGL